MNQKTGLVLGGLAATGFLAFTLSGKRNTTSNNVPAENAVNPQNNALSTKEFQSHSDNPHKSSGVDLKQAKENQRHQQDKQTPKTALSNDGRTPPPGSSATNEPASSRS